MTRLPGPGRVPWPTDGAGNVCRLFRGRLRGLRPRGCPGRGGDAGGHPISLRRLGLVRGALDRRRIGVRR
jgi:hypothetical protein